MKIGLLGVEIRGVKRGIRGGQGGKVGDYSGEMICTFGKIGLLGVYLRGGQGIVESMIGNY